MANIQPGIYQHFKGGMYEVLGIVRHSETEEWLVLYKNRAGDWWVRPHAMFLETVTHDGQKVPRFAYVSRTA
jgi:hypothetical protein